MASIFDGVDKSILEMVSTESFSQNLSAYRSLLLRYLKEIDSGEDVDARRGRILTREASALREIMRSQLGSADAVVVDQFAPELDRVDDIYYRILKTLVSRIWGMAGEKLTAVKLAVEKIPAAGREGQLTKYADQVNGIISLHAQIVGAERPDAEMALRWFELFLGLAQLSNTDSSLRRIAAPPPPAEPPKPPPNGGGDDDLPRRVDRLETKVEKLMDDINDIKIRLGKMDERLSHSASKKDVEDSLSPVRISLAELKERLTHMPTRTEMYLAGGSAVAIILGVLAKGFHWF